MRETEKFIEINLNKFKIKKIKFKLKDTYLKKYLDLQKKIKKEL